MCDLTIDDIIGIGPGPTFIRVTGSVEDCAEPFEGKHVTVDIFCGDESNPIAQEVEADVDMTANTWNVVVPVPVDSGCVCGGTIIAKVRCVTNDDCSADLTVDQLRCPECPEVSQIAAEPGEIECNSDGTASVPWRAFVANNTPNPIVAIFDCGPGGVLASNSPPPSIGVDSGTTEMLEFVCIYPTPSDPKPFIHFTDLTGVDLVDCDDFEFESTPLKPCPCPEVVDLEAVAEGCTVHIEGNLEPPTEDCTYKWDFGDDNEATTNVPEVDHTYQAAGTYAVAVTVECEDCGGYETSTVVAEIVNCVSQGACCLPDGSCEVMTEAECMERGGDYKGDGTDCSACPPPPPCGKPTLILAIAQAVLLSGLIVLNMLKFCLKVEIPNWLYVLLTAAAAAPLIIYVFYELFCKDTNPECCFNECDRYFMAWIPLVSGGIVAMYLAGCCGGWWWALVAGLIGTGLFMFYRWVKVCDPDKCQIASGWGLVIITGVPTAFGIIKLLTMAKWVDTTIPMKLKECPYEWVEIAVIAAGVVLGGIWAYCQFQEEANDPGELDP